MSAADPHLQDVILHLDAAIQAVLRSDALDAVDQKALSERFLDCLTIVAQRAWHPDEVANEPLLQACRQALLGTDALGRATPVSLGQRVRALFDPSLDPARSLADFP